MKARTLALLATLLGLASAVLPGCKGGGESSAPRGSGAAASVNVTANEKGFTPSSFALEKGAPATLIFRRTSDETCAKEVVFPELKITKELPLNVPVPIDVPTGDARTLTFQCGMGMFKGKAVIQ
jgi:plastocyanin domain-containing protein